MAQIHETLGQTGTAAINQAKAISGLGGVGKTQTAIEYAYRYFYDQPTYEWVFWVNASDLTLAASFGSIATDLALPNHETQKLDEKIAAVSHWLETHDRWLLIFDNLDNPKSLQPFRPNNPKGRILITSRAQRFDSLGVAYPITLHAMTATEAHQFLRHRTERTSIDLPEQQAVEALAAALGYLPLALEQAAAYIVAKGVSFVAYLRAYEKRRLQLLEKQQPQTGNYPNSVATTWAINFEAVKTNSPAAADLLNLSAFLAPDNIPYELLAFGKDHMGELLSGALADALEDELLIPELLEELTCYSLIQRETANCYSIHRMVQEVLRDGMDEATRLAWLGRAVEALNAVFPSGEFETWQQCARLVEHGQAIERHLEYIPYHTVSAGRLLNNVGIYLLDQGRYREAEPLLVQSLLICEQHLGETHPDVASSLNNLAGLYQSQGRYKEAEPLHLHALSICEQHLLLRQ
ncbi:MAG: tetratricopeptide repeat protein [Cyanobacteria bacterium RM1_2_2]|nr:tetratricopeptide repeat protein [Cyanobacteria bacterium RM1_2_2]